MENLLASSGYKISSEVCQYIDDFIWKLKKRKLECVVEQTLPDWLSNSYETVTLNILSLWSFKYAGHTVLKKDAQ